MADGQKNDAKKMAKEAEGADKVVNLKPCADTVPPSFEQARLFPCLSVLAFMSTPDAGKCITRLQLDIDMSKCKTRAQWEEALTMAARAVDREIFASCGTDVRRWWKLSASEPLSLLVPVSTRV